MVLEIEEAREDVQKEEEEEEEEEDGKGGKTKIALSSCS